MKEQTKKFYLSIILSLIALFLISCDNKDKTGAEEVKKEERTLSYYAGNWWGQPEPPEQKHLVTINTDGSVTLKGDGVADIVVLSSSVTRVSDTTYTASYSEGKITLIFSSDIQGKLIMEEGEIKLTLDITKK